MNYDERIVKLGNTLNDKKLERAKAEEKQKIEKEAGEKIIAELLELGIEEPDLEDELEKLKISLETKISKCESDLE